MRKRKTDGCDQQSAGAAGGVPATPGAPATGPAAGAPATPPSPDPRGIPGVDEVREVKLFSYFMWPLPVPVGTAEPAHRELTARLLDWLRRGETVPGVIGEAPEGHLRLIIDQVIFHPYHSLKPTVRLRAPELAAWLRGGWQQDWPGGSSVHMEPVDLPLLILSDVAYVGVQDMGPDAGEVRLSPAEHGDLIAPLLEALNQAGQGLPRNSAATPYFMVDIHTPSGRSLSLAYVGTDAILAELDDQPLWISSQAVAVELEPFSHLLGQDGPPPSAADGLLPVVAARVVNRKAGIDRSLSHPELEQLSGALGEVAWLPDQGLQSLPQAVPGGQPMLTLEYQDGSETAVVFAYRCTVPAQSNQDCRRGQGVVIVDGHAARSEALEGLLIRGALDQ